jgi:GNAT superfamily N-acetyltransferase
MAATRTDAGRGGLAIRPATPDDLPACERIWRDSLNDYLARLGQPPVPEDNPGLRRLHAHTLATDPGRFRVATREGHVVAFGSAVQRGPVWFLSMLFVDPAEQARGLGRRLLAEIGPASAADMLATATDSAQPISNGLYASLGIVPRMPLLNAVGRPSAGWTPPALPPGTRTELLALPDHPPQAAAMAGKLGELGELDREVLGFAHPEDHAFALRERPAAFTYRDPDGRLLGYGYTSSVGRIGPVAVRDAELMGPVLGHLLASVVPRGASAVWLPGAAGGAVGLALAAGLRFEDFPLLVCWSRPFADFERYLPISPGLL